MKHFKNLFWVVLLLFTLTACDNNKLTYDISINNNLSTNYFVGDTLDLKEYFIITDSNGNNIEITDSMIDSSKLNMGAEGEYKVTLTYQGQIKEITIKVSKETITYTIQINDSKSTTINLNDSIDFKDYFIITDSKGNNVTILDSMIVDSLVDLNTPGTYPLYIQFEGLVEEIMITVIADTPVTYSILINETKSTSIDLNDSSVDYKDYFILKDSNGLTYEVTDSMIDASNVDLSVHGSYSIYITFQTLTKELIIHVVDSTPIVTYEIKVNESLPKEFPLGISNIDFKSYFNISDSLGNTVEVLNDMLDLSNVTLNKVGTFTVSITCKDIIKNITFTITAPNKMVASDLFISEYSEGSSYNKYIELFNGTGYDLDLSNYVLKLFNNSIVPA